MASGYGNMAEVERKMSEAEDSEKCLICLARFTDLQRLSCSHGLCLTCLQSYIKKKEADRVLYCPECKKESQIPTVGFETLTYSDDTRRISESKQTDSNVVQNCGAPDEMSLLQTCKPDLGTVTTTGSETSSTSLICQLCEENKAGKYCPVCKLSICIRCVKMHSNFPQAKSHGLSDLHVDTQEKVMICENCKIIPYTMRCSHCELNMCDSCLNRHNSFPELRIHTILLTTDLLEQAINPGIQIGERSGKTGSNQVWLTGNLEVGPEFSESTENSSGNLLQLPIDFENIIKIHSLGRVASLGDLYDCRTNTFTTCESLHPDKDNYRVTTDTSRSPKIKVFDPTSIQSRYESFDLTSREKLDVILGISKPEGQALLLKEEHRRKYKEQISRALLYTNSTETHAMDSMDKEFFKAITDQVNKGVLSATHVVVKVQWAHSYVLTFSNMHAGTVIKDLPESAINRVFENIEKSLKNCTGLEYTQRNDLFCRAEMKLFYDHGTLTERTCSPNLDPLDALMKMTLISQFNDSKGSPLNYCLLPLSSVKDFGTSLIDSKVRVTHNYINTDQAEIVLSSFNQLRQLVRQICNLKQETEHDLFILGQKSQKRIDDACNEAESNANCQLNAIKSVVEDFRAKFEQESKLSDILDEHLRQMNSINAKLMSVIETYKEEGRKRRQFHKNMRDLGVQIVDRNAPIKTLLSKTHAENKLNKRYFAMFFSIQSETFPRAEEYFCFKAKYYKFLNTEQKNHDELQDVLWCIAIDLDANPELDISGQNKLKNYVCSFRDDDYKTINVEHELEIECRLNLVQAEVSKASNTSKLTIDQEITVLLPCPKSKSGHCPSETIRWICFNCRTTIKYDVESEKIFCECGILLRHSLQFRCGAKECDSTFVPYEARDLEPALKALKPVRTINILVIGPTGVGKSTWINAMANYITFSSWKEASCAGEPFYLIPTMFTAYDKKKNKIKIKIGEQHSHREVFATRGQSCTQVPLSYLLPFGDINICLIDTPGIGDTDGQLSDEIKSELILDYLENFEELHGICVVLKADNSRLSDDFRYCFLERLKPLHGSAAENLVFCFTHSTDFTSGESIETLNALLNGMQSQHTARIGRQENVFCVDNSCIRSLYTFQQTKCEAYIHINDLATENSWQRSSEESRSMIKYIRDLKPHPLMKTRDLHDARKTVTFLMEPLVHLTDNILENIKLRKRAAEKVMEEGGENRGDEHRPIVVKQIQLQKETQLDKPGLVCTSISCTRTEYLEDTGVSKITHKIVCEDKSSFIIQFIKKFWRKLPGQRNCAKCGCVWANHFVTMYVIDKVTTEVEEENIKKLSENIAKDEDNLKRMNQAAATFVQFLMSNALVPYNDAYRQQVKRFIKMENEKKTPNQEAESMRTSKVESLERILNEHDKLMQLFDEHVSTNDASGCIGSVEVREAKADLDKMPGVSEFLADLFKDAEKKDDELKKQSENLYQNKYTLMLKSLAHWANKRWHKKTNDVEQD